MSTDYRYTVRNVAQKEIYDSYMGILRISPILDDNGKMVDDPTNFLNTIGYQDIQLSSSNGDPLPVHFVPYAFQTSIINTIAGNVIKEQKNIINICTDTTITNYASGNTYVSESFIARSSIHLIDSSEKKKSKIAIAYGCHTTDDNQKADCEGILLYPIESPNDSTYFNNKNTLNLFDVDDSRPRTEQVEEALLGKTLHWYNTTVNDDIFLSTDTKINSLNVNKNIQSHRVKANNQLINQINDLNEEIPVLYSRDYVLGHYEGHSQRTNAANRNTLKREYLPESSQIYEAEETNNVTKLSWIRFDNLIWECLDEVLAGKLRHVNGRYDNLGTGIGDKGNSIRNKLFGQETVNNIPQYSNLYPSESPSQFLDYTAPLVGKGVQEGMIMYHAMPFHRYWFHRCRQVLFNMEEFKKQFNLAYDDSTSTVTWEDMNDTERGELQEFYNAKLITPCCKASITPHHSLVKDFLLCNGQEATLENFPNISLNNNNLLKEADGDLKRGKQAIPNKDKTFNQKSQWSVSSTYYALKNSLGGTNGIKLPNLFNFQEKYPRFIRGLNWKADTENIQDFSITNETINVDSSLTENNNRMAYIQNDEINTKKNIWGEDGKCIIKNLKTVDKPYYFSFDYLTQKNKHRHLLFSKNIGITIPTSQYTLLANYPYLTSSGGPTIPDNVFYLPIFNNNRNGEAENLYSEEWNNWYNYNFKNEQIYKGFQPIHTAGLYYFSKEFTPNVTNIPDGASWHYYDAEGKKHLMNTAKISKTPSSSEDFQSLNTYRFERNKRKQLIVKLNESEGLFPLSPSGGPNFFKTEHWHWWQRKKKGRGYDAESGLLTKQNVATYKLQGAVFKYSIDKNGEYDVEKFDDGTYHWRTLTSLQYWDCNKLGVGDIEKIENEKYLKRDTIPPTANDYYNYHNVTDIWRKESEQKSEELTYGSTTTKVDTSSPYPSFLSLIPLIRL